MKHKDFQQFTRDTFEECIKIMDEKGPDYSGLDDRLLNFKRSAEKYGTTPVQALAILLDKHLQAIETYVKTGKLTGEPIEEKLRDVINYFVLMKALIFEIKRVEVPRGTNKSVN